MRLNPLPSRNAQSFPKTAKTARPYSPRALSSSKRKLFTIGGIALLLIGLGFGAVLIFGHFRQNPLLAEIDRLRAQMEANGGQPWDAKNRDLANEMRQKIEQLPPELQAEFQKRMRERMMKQGGPSFGKAIQDFFDLSAAEQLAALDKALQENLERQKQWGSMFGGGAGQPGSGDKSGSSSSQSGDNTSGPPPGHPPFGGSDAQRLQFRQQMDQTIPPDQRAQFTVWRQMMQSRAATLGLPPSAAFGPPPGMGPPPH